MSEPSVETLLQAYVNEGSEAAFTGVVQRCTGLVYATALRRVGGDAHLARDVAQLVFVDLAGKARTFARGTVIAGWLYHHTCFRAATVVRSERRRRIREEKAAEMEEIEHAENGSWQTIEPWLDPALESLPDRDRDAILLRFFSDEAFASLGERWGITEDAAQKRVSRALERLRRSFARRGIATSTAALASVFAANGVQAAPAGLAASAAHLALVGAASAGRSSALATAAAFLMETKAKLAIAATVGALATGIIVTQQRQNDRLRAELEAARTREAASWREVPNSARTVTSRSAVASVAANVPPSMIASADLEAVMAQVVRDRLWEADPAAFQELLARIETHDLPVALGYVGNHTTGLIRRNVRSIVVEYWATRDPASAAAWCLQAPPSAEREQLNRTVSNLWARSDPDAALHFAFSPDALRQVALHEPERAENETLRLPPGGDRDLAIYVTTTTKLDQDPRGFVRWIEKLEGDDRATALSAVMPQLTESDPMVMANYVEKLPPTEHSLQAGRDFAVVWANQDPAAAANWSSTLPPDSALRSRVISGIAEIWAGSDPTQAAAWIARMPSDQVHENAAKVYVDNVALYNPAAAAALVPQLAAGAREAAIRKIGQSWLKWEPGAARQWLTQLSLSEDQIKALETK